MCACVCVCVFDVTLTLFLPPPLAFFFFPSGGVKIVVWAWGGVCVCPPPPPPPPPPRRWEADVTLPAEEWMAPVIKIHEENRGNGEDWPGERRQQQRGVHSLFSPFFNSVAPRCSSDAFSRNTAGIHVCCCGGGGAESSG